MKNRIKLLILLIATSIGFGINTITTAQTQISEPVITKPSIQRAIGTAGVEPTYVSVNSLDIVANPVKYLNKHVKVTAIFDKFSNLGLDYKPALRSSEKYISFLIKRDDVVNHTIPLSEMKIFLLRSEAEKYIDLEVGDKIEFSGFVFSNALGDPWIDVEKFTVLSTKPKDKNSTKK